MTFIGLHGDLLTCEGSHIDWCSTSRGDAVSNIYHAIMNKMQQGNCDWHDITESYHCPR